MAPKSSMLVASLSVWMYAAIACAALPFFYALPQLKDLGSMAPLIAALVVGALVSVPLSLVVRRMSGFDAPDKNLWGAFSAREAMFFGVVCWGMPVGLMFVVNEFLEHSNPFALVSAVIVWPTAGVAFGLLARWLAQRRVAGQVA